MLTMTLTGETTQLERITDSMRNIYDGLKASALYVAGEVATNFKVGGRPPWSGAKTLCDSGKLMRAATSVRIAGNRAEIGGELSNVPYAGVHQLGSDLLPARPYMTLPDGWRDNAMNEFASRILEDIDDTV